MQKLRIEKPGCWGAIDGVFQQLPVGHEFIAASVPPAFAGRVSVVGEVGEQELEVATPGDTPAGRQTLPLNRRRRNNYGTS